MPAFDPVVRMSLRSLSRYAEKADQDLSKMTADFPMLADMLRQYRDGTWQPSNPWFHDEPEDEECKEATECRSPNS